MRIVREGMRRMSLFVYLLLRCYCCNKVNDNYGKIMERLPTQTINIR